MLSPGGIRLWDFVPLELFGIIALAFGLKMAVEAYRASRSASPRWYLAVRHNRTLCWVLALGLMLVGAGTLSNQIAVWTLPPGILLSIVSLCWMIVVLTLGTVAPRWAATIWMHPMEVARATEEGRPTPVFQESVRKTRKRSLMTMTVLVSVFVAGWLTIKGGFGMLPLVIFQATILVAFVVMVIERRRERVGWLSL